MAITEKQKEEEKRRLHAGRLLLKGMGKSEVARRCGVSPTSVMRWDMALREGGLDALRIQRGRGRPSKLGGAQRQALAKELQHGALAQGYATELWTLPRIRTLIAQRFDVRVSDAQVSRILAQMGWSCQRPTGRAVQRDEEAIRTWKKKRWPALKKTPQNAGKRSSSSTNRD
jgi:transposase